MSTKKSTSSPQATHDLKTYDLFQLSPFLSVGEPYVDDKSAALKDDRYKGKQLGIIPPKRGVLNDTTFGKFQSLATSEPYQAPSPPKRFSSSSKPVSSKPFLPSNPTKKLTGPGDVHGCFNQIEYMSEGEMEMTKSPTSSRSSTASSTKRTTSSVSPRNFYTNPTKKGGPGFASNTIGGFSYPYMSEPYGGDRMKIEKTKPKTPTVPFRSMSPPGGCFDSKIYSPITTMESKSAESSPTSTRPSTRAGTTRSRGSSFCQTVPFRPSSPGKRGITGTLAPFPEYVVGADLKPERPKTSMGIRQKVFLPAGTSRVSTPQPSILSMSARYRS
ncbi:putative protein of unknown function (DUF4586) [Monocercomonoides exilis]|uniref:putative protein of unknown function (DUF4586) n=1 Tax=Monocercomonoides exilis TaxID=2049356 RepID=UPI003559C14B|nr:putative protein of unknown function (DUF4586) [Monocercomonoides exilis]|eukprot:MONOS_11847.1-p1 / transcript=MONOS_11847.1 / gene=MONOS_11847 / organism=Monocercomonoides_exilis_PA203 / gene_product=unspecified product / transcript_product=unspecified product / location=Mono_scaffold00618:775-2204(-) / protein_length=328 / sequence_SO=supercontig / SO=protein_coding / is_pseudo=false